MKAFVTGGSGFAGRNLIRALAARSDGVSALARSDAATQAIEALGATTVRGQLDDREHLEKGMRGCDTVFHYAALLGQWGPESEYRRVNVEGTRNVLDAARAAGVRRVVHMSTEAVLMDARGTALVNADETWPYARNPLPRYPRTKCIAEQLVLGANDGDLETVAIRPPIIWGRDDTTTMPALVDMVQSGRFTWIDHGRPLTSTCHVDNLTEGALLAAERGRGGEAYFLTDGEPVRLREFLGALIASQGLEAPTRSVPYRLARPLARTCEFVWERLGIRAEPPMTRMMVDLLGQEITVHDAKARRELGYTAHIDRETGLAGIENFRRAAGAA